MEKTIKILTIVALIGLIVGSWVYILGDKGVQLGGSTAGYWDSAEGYYVDGTQIIDGSGNYVGAITATTETLSSTLTVTGETNVSNLVYGGSVSEIATTSAGIAQMTAAQFCNNSIGKLPYFHITSSTIVYLPTGPQLIADCLPTAGDTKSLRLWNNSSDTTDLVITASTSIQMKLASGTSATVSSAAGTAGAKGWADITCLNLGDATSTCEVIQFK